MNLGFYMEKLHSSDKFQTFLKENPSAYLCAGFFVIDMEKKDNKVHFDYLNPENKKISSFQMDNGIKVVDLDNIEKGVFESISDSIEIDFDEIQEIIEGEMERNNVKSKIQKIMLSLQKNDGKIHLIGTVFISSLGMVRINISLPEKEITQFEKKSFFDIVNVFKK